MRGLGRVRGFRGLRGALLGARQRLRRRRSYSATPVAPAPGRTTAWLFLAVDGVLPGVLAVHPGELEELLAQGLVVLPPPVTALLGLLGRQRLRGQPGVIGVLGADLH